MATTYKVLGQAAPAGTTNTDLLTVGSGKSVVISTLAIANTTGTAATARVFVRQGGATAATSNAIIYDVSVGANATIALTLGITLAATDVVTVQTGTANALTFHAYGQENA